MSQKGSNELELVYDEAHQGDQEQQVKHHKRDGILTLIGGFFLMLYLGCFFLWGNISVYVVSYFHYVNGTSNFSFIYLVDSMLVFSNLAGY